MGDRDPPALTASAVPAPATAPDPFSFAEPATVQAILTAAGFVDVGFADVREPVYYGPDVAAALDLVRDMRGQRLLARLDCGLGAACPGQAARDARRARDRAEACCSTRAPGSSPPAAQPRNARGPREAEQGRAPYERVDARHGYRHDPSGAARAH